MSSSPEITDDESYDSDNESGNSISIDNLNSTAGSVRENDNSYGSKDDLRNNIISDDSDSTAGSVGLNDESYSSEDDSKNNIVIEDSNATAGTDGPSCSNSSNHNGTTMRIEDKEAATNVSSVVEYLELSFEKLSTKTNSRISEVNNFGEKGDILNSTMIKPLREINMFESIESNIVNNTRKSSPRKKFIEERTPAKEKPIDFSKESMRTPRNIRQEIPSRSPSPDVLISDDETDDDQNNIIDISDEDPEPKQKNGLNKPKQLTLEGMVIRRIPEKIIEPPQEHQLEKKVSAEDYQKQREKVSQLEVDVGKAKNALRTVNLNNLPDKGKLLIERHHTLENILKKEVNLLEQMVIDTNTRTTETSKKTFINWGEIEEGASAVQPKTFGKTAMATYNAQKALTMERLEILHGSLKSCPTESTLAEDPRGLKVDLMPHQKRALAWLMWRETQKPSGGILADDMGLGKTLSMIALMLKSLEIEKANDDDDENEENEENFKKLKYKGGTLIVCPASLLGQWTGELDRRTTRGLVSREVYHGAKRETKAKRLASYDMVVTTYSIVQNEVDINGAIFRVKWRRIVLDEAHQIRNYKAKTSLAACNLSGKSRWSLTGTPIHNKELDMYAQLKFLRCTPFDELPTFKRWVGDKSTGGQERLHTVISSLMLRRTKVELMAKGALQSLPERNWELYELKLDKEEMDVYSKILIFSRTLFAQYLHQHAEKNQDRRNELTITNGLPNDPNQEYHKMRNKLMKFNKCRDVKQHEILVLLLRLRQICCHPSLITGMLNGDEDIGSEDTAEDAQDMNLLDQLNKLNLDDDEHEGGGLTQNIAEEGIGLKEACKNILNPSNPIFSENTKTTKVKIVLDTLKCNVLSNGDKAIVVSQWTSLLNIIAKHLKNEGIYFDQLDGSIPVHKRGEIVDKFNDPNHKNQILLLSLTAGGVGLNLVGANHLLLLDLHWNPQLESQAQDRIYRVGQKKKVNIYKFMASNTIEERIKQLQDKKKEIAESLLTGTKQSISSKLSLQDLKMLFEM